MPAEGSLKLNPPTSCARWSWSRIPRLSAGRDFCTMWSAKPGHEAERRGASGAAAGQKCTDPQRNQAYLQREQPNVLPKSPEGQAISYTLSNWQALIRYCKDGDLEIDNSGAERSLRGVALRRNPAAA